MVLLNTNNGDIISGESRWCFLDEYDKDLRSDSDWDIVKVIQPSRNKYYYNIDEDFRDNLLWERKESKSSNITINILAELDEDAIQKIKDTITELQEQLNDLKVTINFS